MFINYPGAPAAARKGGGALSPAWLLAAWLAGACLPSRAEPPSAQVDFNFQIRPLLSDRCFQCHGPDERTRKAKLRLDLADQSTAVRDAKTGRRAIAPGRPDESELYRRVTATNPSLLMPPRSSNLALTAEEKELLRHWIEQGAEYQPHWAFLPVGEVAVPAVAGAPTPSHPIDAFVRARLAAEGLKPSPEASREQLIRRLSFDLTGLPPTLGQIDEFLADTSSEAYEKVVDRLLASPAYGERQAGEWLDLARYADTYGYQNDVERDLSPWRDWVIQAFNDNLPYDQFLLWQLAGDLLPAPTREQVLATAFNRLHRQTNEGGSIAEEFRTEYVADRVNTTGTAMLGLTVECARCHDHKYDPIAQQDYYRLFAFFNNLDESGLYSHFTTATPTPTMLLYPEGKEAAHESLKQQIAAREEDLEALARSLSARFESWVADGRHRGDPPVPVAGYSFELVSSNSTPNGSGSKAPARLVEGPAQVAGRVGQALQFSGDNAVVCTGAGDFNRVSPFSFSVWLRPAERRERAVVFHRSRAWSDSGSRGYELVLDQGRPAFGLIHFWPGNAIQVRARDALPTNEWSHLTLTYDGSSRAAGVGLYLNGSPLAVEVVRDHLYKDILHRNQWGDAEVGGIELTLAERFRDSGFRNGAIDEFQVFDRCLTPLEASMVAGRAPADPDRTALRDYYLQRLDPDYQAALAELRRLRARENDLVNDVREIMVMREMPWRRPTHLLRRGAYDAPGEVVEPGVPERIFPFPEGLPPNRLGLARWVIDRRNPLTARVEANRVWKSHFGRGLVATTENFGSQGQLPTHPELLDWLAKTLMDTGWDLKALHKLVVTSAAYRQSSRAAPGLAERDPDNRLLARGPRHRLDAEQIRDQALAVSGLLLRQVGGPSVKPYQPEGLWEEAGTGKHYVQDHGAKLYRRSLYTFWRRTSPPPNMLAFDATSREVCTARREITSTPLQALVLLNDPQFVEAARILAERLLRNPDADGDARQLEAFRLATGRRPEPRELAMVRRLYEEQRERFEGNESLAGTYLKTGEHPVDASLPVVPLAATAAMVSALMNLDEFVVLR